MTTKNKSKKRKHFRIILHFMAENGSRVWEYVAGILQTEVRNCQYIQQKMVDGYISFKTHEKYKTTIFVGYVHCITKLSKWD